MHRAIRVAVGAALILSGASVGHTADPVFTDVTLAAGIDHIQFDSPNPTGSQFAFSGAVAAGDYDNDGNVDLLFSRLAAPDVLYRNRGDGTFEDVTQTAIPVPAAGISDGLGWADFDNDGHLDFYNTTLGGNRFNLYMNDGNGVFTEQAVARGAAVVGPDAHYGQSVSYADYDNDGFLDVFVAEWRLDSQNPTQAASNNRLLRNVGAANPGHFEDVTIAAGVGIDHVPNPFGAEGVFGFTPRFSDFDDDGNIDLFVAADQGTSRLFWNNGDGSFTDGTAAAGVEGGDTDMGATTGDYNGDGRIDLFITAVGIREENNIQGGGNRLFRNEGNRQFSHQSAQAGVQFAGFGWGTDFLDIDNDGDLDLAMTNGIDTGSEQVVDRTTLWRNDDGSFTDISLAAGIVDEGPGPGLITLDYDNDGDSDIIVVNHRQRPILYRNDGGNDNDWLKLSLYGTASNLDGIGARIVVTPELGGPSLLREVSASSTYLSQSSSIPHFGLGPGSGPIDLVEVFWPSGLYQALADVSPNQTLSVFESAATAQVVPEPSTWLSYALGVTLLAVHRRLRRKTMAGSRPPQRCLIERGETISATPSVPVAIMAFEAGRDDAPFRAARTRLGIRPDIRRRASAVIQRNDNSQAAIPSVRRSE